MEPIRYVKLVASIQVMAFSLPSKVKCFKSWLYLIFDGIRFYSNEQNFEKIFGGRGIQTSHRKHTRLIIILMSINKRLMRIKSNMVEAEISESKLNLARQGCVSFI